MCHERAQWLMTTACALSPSPPPSSSPSTCSSAAQIEDLQALLAAKDDLLKRSLDNVSAWEAKFAQLRESQKALTFNT
eukprot:3356711-Rhodomonas_salina.7